MHQAFSAGRSKGEQLWFLVSSKIQLTKCANNMRYAVLTPKCLAWFAKADCVRLIWWRCSSLRCILGRRGRRLYAGWPNEFAWSVSAPCSIAKFSFSSLFISGSLPPMVLHVLHTFITPTHSSCYSVHAVWCFSTNMPNISTIQRRPI